MTAGEMKHTAGPWRFVDEGNGDYAIRAFEGPIEVQPARAFGLKDARLIAAAPELLEALNCCVKYMAGPGDGSPTELTAILIKAYAAIAKAAP